jgi:hypothetical protein
MKPTLASLKRELAAMDKERADLIAALATMSARTNRTDAALDAIRIHLRPVLAYFGQQWIGDAVRADFQALVTLCERTGR